MKWWAFWVGAILSLTLVAGVFGFLRRPAVTAERIEERKRTCTKEQVEAARARAGRPVQLLRCEWRSPMEHYPYGDCLCFTVDGQVGHDAQGEP